MTDSSARMIIHAASIHLGGGKILLDQLLVEKTFGQPSHVICDTRYVPPEGLDYPVTFHPIAPKLWSRWKAELVLRSICLNNPGQNVLCFSNLPPAFKLKAKVILFLQNGLLLPNAPLYTKSFKTALRIIYERIWLNFFWKNIDEIWVQTMWMKEALVHKNTPILVRPIVLSFEENLKEVEKEYDFITVTGTAAHKRLSNLLKAWELMPDPAPRLLVILDNPDSSLEESNLVNKNVVFKSNLSRAEIYDLYNSSKCLITTSKIESYCLPIYEALHFKLKILAPDEKYVREACTPDLFISPDDPYTLNQQVLRYYNKVENKKNVLKILNVNQSIDPVRSGGCGERTVRMSKAFANLGHDCTILSLSLGNTEDQMSELHNIKFVGIPCINERYYIPWPNLRLISDTVRDSDIVHLMNHWSALNVIVYFYIRKFKKKYVVCPAGGLPIFGRSKILKKFFNNILGRRIIYEANAHIIISEDEIQHYFDYGVSQESIISVPNGIDPTPLQKKDDLSFRTRFNLGDAPFIFFMGRINPIKGPDLLVQAFCQLKKQFPDHQLVLAGPDEGMMSSLKKIINTHGMESRVHFIGHVAGELKSHALHAASLMVIPSRQEAMSIVVLEAGIAGLPVLLTDQCGLNNLQSLNAGIVVSATMEGIQTGLSSVLNDQLKLKEMGKNLEQYVYDKYLWSSVIRKLEALYVQLLEK